MQNTANNTAQQLVIAMRALQQVQQQLNAIGGLDAYVDQLEDMLGNLELEANELATLAL